MIEFFGILGIIIFALIFCNFIDWLSSWIIISYWNYIFQVEESGILIIVQLLLEALCLTFITLFWGRIDSHILFNNTSDRLAVVFGLLAVYVLNFSVMRFYLLNEQKNERSYLGVPIIHIPDKIKLLDNFEKQPFINFCIFYLVFWSLFISNDKSTLCLNIWYSTLSIVMITTILNIIWGYSSLNSIKRTNDMIFYENSITQNLVNLFKTKLLEELFWNKSNAFNDCIESFMRDVSENERGKFLNTVYCYNIWKVSNKVNDSIFKNFYINKLYNDPGRLFNLELSFYKRMSIRKISDYEYLPNILEDTYSLFNSLYNNVELFDKVIMDQFLKRQPTEVLAILFPGSIVNFSISDSKYWEHINRIFSNELGKLVANCNSNFRKTKKTDKSVKKFQDFQKDIQLKVEYMINYQFKVVEYKNELDYSLFVNSICPMFDGYSIKYIVNNMKDLTNNLSEEQIRVIKTVVANWKTLKV